MKAENTGRDVKNHRVSVDLSFGSVSSVLKKVKVVPWLFRKKFYAVFTFETLQNSQLTASKLLKKCFVGFIWCTTLCTNEGGSFRGVKTFLSFQGSMLPA